MADWKGLLISYAYIFMVLALGEGIRAWKNYPSDFTRKCIHIGVGFWGLIAYWTDLSYWAALIPPASFILINLVSFRWSLLKSMELEDKSNLGTVYYPISLTILLALFWKEGTRIIPMTALLIMALGDGFASITGRKWGKHALPSPVRKKTVEGSIAMWVFSAAAVVLVNGLVLFVPWPTVILRALILATLATVVEAASPRGTDNLTVPLLSGFCFWLFFLRG
jgi:phytol kinase